VATNLYSNGGVALSGPNYFHCAPKTGSTTLFYIFQKHRDICVARGKEPNFFSVDDYYTKGEKFFWSDRFAHYEGEKIAGDFSTNYLREAVCKKSLSRIFRQRSPSDTYFSTCVRHPLAWHWSHYLHRVRNVDGFRNLSPITETFQKYLDDSQKNNHLFSVFDQLSQLKQIYSKQSDKKNLLVLIYERSVLRDISVAYAEICRFLCVDPANFEPLVDGIVSSERRESSESISSWNDIGTFAKLKANRSYLPAIYSASSAGESEGGERFSRGDIIIERDSANISVIRNPSLADQKKYLEYYAAVTTDLSVAQAGELTDRYFDETIQRTEEQLEQVVPEWRPCELNLPEIEWVEPSYG
jgi:hypothetical protein